LNRAKFDCYVERIRRKYYAPLGRPSIAPGVCFRCFLVGFFEGIELGARHCLPGLRPTPPAGVFGFELAGARTTPLGLTEQESQELRHIAASGALPASDVFRARLILLLPEGRSYAAIKRELHTTAPTIARWKQRFPEKRLDGLMENRHPRRQPTVMTPRLQARVPAATQRPPRDGATHWSCRKLARDLGLSKDAVHRIWRTAELKPHRLERYLASNNRDFERKAADIIGLYLDPPQHAAVFCVDEKSAIQALVRLDPALPLSPGRLERQGFEYYRHGTLWLYAALDVERSRCRTGSG
jgi:transposase